MPASLPALRFDAVTKRFGATIAVDAISLEVAPRDFVALVGMSGSGKSTLLKTVNRLIVPNAGMVSIDGRDVMLDPAPLLRRRIGYVFQNIGLFPHLTVAENIAIGPRLAGHRMDQAEIDAALIQVELDPALARRRPDQLSGGQRQRVGVARALATAPGLLLMDEPFGALDPVTRDTLGRTVRTLHQRLGLTTVMVTHDMAEALLLADRIIVMAAGRIVGDATPAAVLAGKAGPAADALVAVPRAQMAALAALSAPADAR